jgi:hypothetical protein
MDSRHVINYIDSKSDKEVFDGYADGVSSV